MPEYYQGQRFDKMNPEFMQAFEPMAQEYYQRTGKPLRVTDTFRTNEEQADLYRRKPKLAARPGHSQHEHGLAMDIDQRDVPRLEKLGLLDKYGFVRPVLSKGETWHIELPNTRNTEAVMAQRFGEMRRGEKTSPGSDFMANAMQFYINRGYTPEQSAGIVGNLMHESEGGKADIWNKSKTSYGLAQWEGPRLKALRKFAGTDNPNREQQLAFIDHELNTSEQKALKAIRNAKTPEESARLFSQLYERPGKPMLNKRLEYAQQAMKVYQGQSDTMMAKEPGWQGPGEYDQEGKLMRPLLDVATEMAGQVLQPFNFGEIT